MLGGNNNVQKNKKSFISQFNQNTVISKLVSEGSTYRNISNNNDTDPYKALVTAPSSRQIIDPKARKTSKTCSIIYKGQTSAQT